jgi:hypothetical protein
VADEEFGRQIPFGFLEKVKDDFLKNYGETAKNAVAMSLQRVYRRVRRAAERTRARAARSLAQQRRRVGNAVSGRGLAGAARGRVRACFRALRAVCERALTPARRACAARS